MIVIVDLCDPPALKSPDEQALLVFSRVALEFLITKPHKFKLQIFIKARSDFLTPEIGGFSYPESTNEFVIVLVQDERKNMGLVLANELVHIRQILEDGLIIDHLTDKVFWKGKQHMSARLLTKLIVEKERDRDLYSKLPWVAEAAGVIQATVDHTSQRIEALQKEDLHLTQFLLECQTSMNYKSHHENTTY